MSDPSTTATLTRESAFTADTLGHVWRSTPLHPWGHRRELLYLTLQGIAEQDITAPAINTLDQLEAIEARVADIIAKTTDPALSGTTPEQHLNWSRFVPAAACVLWLAHHTPDDWQHLRADPVAWLSQIEAWSDEHIAAAEVIPAVRLAHQLRTAHHQFITQPRPDGSVKNRDSGN
jgi:hypothetical protein